MKLKIYVLVTVLALGLGILYTCSLNEEIQWLKNLNTVKVQANRDTVSPQGRILLVGGSNVLFGFDPAIISKITRKPVINLGLHAGMGAWPILEYSKKMVKQGDIVIISIEPALLTGDTEPTPLGHQFMLNAFNQYNWTPSTFIKSISASSKPGLQVLSNHLGKILSHRHHRYLNLPIDPNGYMPKKVNKVFTPEIIGNLHLSQQWNNYLKQYIDELHQKNIFVAYTAPMIAIESSSTGESQIHLDIFLSEINQLIPVVPNPTALSNNLDFFSDTPLHMSELGASIRSKNLAQALKSALWKVLIGQ